MRQATAEDFKYGAYFYDKSGNEFIISGKYEEGVFEADCYSGDRRVGGKLLFVNEAKFYKVVK